MASKKKRTPQVENVRAYVEGVAKNLVDRLYGPSGPPWGTKLTELEDVALAIRETLSEAMLEQALTRQAAQEERPAEFQVCPGCGRPPTPCAPEPRIVQTRGGETQWQEPHNYCRKCRQAFFPSEPKPGHRSQ